MSHSHPVLSILYKTIKADGIDIFYRESGAKDAPVLLLLHGFAASSHMFRDLMPLLAEKYRLIAPDLPSFGFTVVPTKRNYKYSFDNLALTIEAFVNVMNLDKFALYVFDYGAPVGLRLAAAHPERITALISQNGNAYLEGLGDAWEPIQKYWTESTDENRNFVRSFLNLDGIKWQYVHGVSEPEKIAPETYHLATTFLEQPGNIDIQLDLFLNYKSNLKMYPTFQKFFQDTQLPTLVIWGKNDPFFIPAGAEAYSKDNPNAVIQLLDTGHFALETHVEIIASEIDKLLSK